MSYCQNENTQKDNLIIEPALLSVTGEGIDEHSSVSRIIKVFRDKGYVLRFKFKKD